MAYYQNNNRDKKIEEMHKAKVQRWDNSSLSAQIGGLMHDVIQIVLFKAKKTDSKEKILKEITFWLSALREVSDAEKEPSPVDWDKVEKEWDEKKQDLYNNQSQLEDINKELQV